MDLCRALREHGYRGWVVGGCLRDLLRGKPAADWDLATDAVPDQVKRVFPRVIPTGIQHGTVTVRHRGQSYELTTLRGEGAYSDGRRPDSVTFVSDIAADLGRRDFTINALAYDPIDDRLTDPFGGLRDLDARLIRAVGDARERFSEDGLRVLRAARFAATLGFELDQATEKAIGETLATFSKVSTERVRDEWLKALKAQDPAPAFRIMRRTGILRVCAPALDELAEPEFERSLDCLRKAPLDSCVRMAVLFRNVTDLKSVLDWLVRYRFSNAEQERVLRLLRHAAPERSDDWSDADVRRFAREVGREHVGEVVEFGVLTAEVERDVPQRAPAAKRLRERLGKLIRPEIALTSKDLAIGGRDLMTELGIAPGKQLGELIEALMNRVLEQPELNTREALLATARSVLAKS
jgi:tRNA nucleotidyltransferase (CCA-adding enzyme)